MVNEISMETIEKKYSIPKTIEEAIKLASQDSVNSRYISGGTDVMVNKYQGNDTVAHYIDLTKLVELKGIRVDDENLYIGALTILSDLKKIPEINAEFPVLLEAANAVGSPLIRKTATLGGNILCENRCIYFNQSEWWREAVGYCLKCSGTICIATGGKKACFSEFVSDTVPALIGLNAKVKLVEPSGERIIAVEELFSGDGVQPKTIKSTTILKEIILPRKQNFRSVFKKLRMRESLEFTSLTTVVSTNSRGGVTIAMAGVDPKPVVVRGSKNDTIDDLIKTAKKGARAVENDMFSRDYRRNMIDVYLHQSFQQLNFE